MPKHYNLHSDLEVDPYEYTNSCLHCGQENIIRIDQDSYRKWKLEGNYVQDVFTSLSRNQLEVLISGTHAECWELIFPSYDDEDPYLLEILDAKNDHP